MHIMNRNYEDRASTNQPIALVLAPTRELTEQIRTECKPYFIALGCSSLAIYGGSSRFRQVEALKRTPHMLIATPGRLNDLIETGNVSVENVSFLVLDEADRMLDMGFEPQIRSIIDQTKKTRQTLMWSATWPREVKSLANEFLSNPAYLQVGGRNLTANRNIKQEIIKVNRSDKYAALSEWIKKIKQVNGKALIFSQTKRGIQQLESQLYNEGVQCVTMHGDMDQRVSFT
jgi:ATP-dependent RNA helicase DDX5/DBP2